MGALHGYDEDGEHVVMHYPDDEWSLKDTMHAAKAYSSMGMRWNAQRSHNGPCHGGCVCPRTSLCREPDYRGAPAAPTSPWDREPIGEHWPSRLNGEPV